MINTIDTKKNIKGNVSIFEILFQICMISFPFGAKILSLYLGFFTIYPYLFFLGILIIYSFSFKIIKIPKYYIIFIAYLSVLLAYAIIRAFMSGFSSYAVFDIRNLLLFLSTIFLLFRSDAILGWNKLKSILGNIFGLFFITFTLVAIFEYLTGIHIWGQHVETLMKLPVSATTYSPVFCYDNPNNFITYYILIGLTVIMLNDEIQHNLWISLIIVGLMFCFSMVSDSRLGKIASVIILIGLFPYHLFQIKSFLKNKKYSIILILSFVLIAFFFNKLYFGPLWSTTDRYVENEILIEQSMPTIKIFNIYQLDSSSNKQMIVSAYKKFREEQNQKGSDAIRLKLIKNGIYLFKTSNGFGVGPGMFRYLHNEKKIPENVGEQNGPHNWIIELLSQYGFFCLIYIFFVLFMIWKSILLSKYHQRYSIIFIISIIGFFIMSNSPSGFGLLDINWIFTGIMILFFTNEITKTSAIENKSA